MVAYDEYCCVIMAIIAFTKAGTYTKKIEFASLLT